MTNQQGIVWTKGRKARFPRLRRLMELRYRLLVRSIGADLEYVDRLGYGGNKVFLVRQHGAPCVAKVAFSSRPKRYRELELERRVLAALGHREDIPELLGHAESSSLRVRLFHFLLIFGFVGRRVLIREYVEGAVPEQLGESDSERIRDLTRSVHEAGLAGLDYRRANFVRRTDGSLAMVDFLATSAGVERSEGEVFERRTERDWYEVRKIEDAARGRELAAGAPEAEVSVVIVSWNTRELLRDCLDSLRVNNGKIRTEVWVIDNGSSDGSAGVVRTDFPEVRLVENRWNRGFAGAANQGLRRSRGRHYLLLNSDTRVLPGAIPEMVKFLDAHPEAAVCGPQLVFEDGRPQNSASSFPSLATELLNKSLLRLIRPDRYPSKAAPGADPREVDSVIGAAMMVRAEAARAVGLLDEDYFFFLEETDWCRRFRDSGWAICQVPAARVVHLQGKSAEQVHARARIEYFRSRYTYFRKHESRVAETLLRVVLPIRVLASFLSNGIISLFGLIRSRPAERFRVHGSILRWHLAGCPADGGLQTGAESATEPANQPPAP